MVAHQLLKGPQGALELLVGLGPAADHVVAEPIADRQGVAPLRVAQQEPAFEVHRPDVVGMSRLGQLCGRHRIESGPTAPGRDQPMAPQDRRDRATRRWWHPATLFEQQRIELLRSPRLVTPPPGQELLHHLRRRAMRTPLRPMAARLQSEPPGGLIPPQPLVAGLPADVKIRTQLRVRKAATDRETDVAIDLFHGGYFVPGHSPKV